MGCFLIEKETDGFTRPTSVADDGDEARFHVFTPPRTTIPIRSGAIVICLVLPPSLLPVVQA